jgi:hypothetical protein
MEPSLQPPVHWRNFDDHVSDVAAIPEAALPVAGNPAAVVNIFAPISCNYLNNLHLTVEDRANTIKLS